MQHATLPSVIINCDMGEGIGNDELIMPFVHAANIACSYHAGDEHTMWQTIALAKKYHVAIGAHVSFLDRKNFGRTELNLTPAEIYELVQQQLILINEVLDSFEVPLYHVKPHGALYNMAARDAPIARAIANAIKDYDLQLVLFGLSGSHSIAEAKSLGLETRNEVFADRTYQDDGSLTPRSNPNALIDSTHKAVEQVKRFVEEGTVVTVSGNKLKVNAETICIHGDGPHAVELSKAIHEVIFQR